MNCKDADNHDDDVNNGGHNEASYVIKIHYFILQKLIETLVSFLGA